LKHSINKIRGITLKIREVISSGELDGSQRKLLWADVRELEGLMKKFRLKALSNINRKALQSALVRLSADLLEIVKSKDRE